MEIKAVASAVGLTIRRRPLAKVIIAVFLAAGFVVSLNSGLLSCSSATKDKTARPLTDTELDRLASMRMHNFGDGRVGVRGTIGKIGTHTSVTGWVDWRRSLIYLAVSSTAQGGVALVQARPGVVAIRPNPDGAPSGGDADRPPPQPPADGWRVRPLNLAEDDEAPLDNLIAFLFLLARDRPDRKDLLSKVNNQWVHEDTAQGVAVDVVLGPAVLPVQAASSPSAPPSPSASSSPSAPPSPSPSPMPDPSSLEAHGGAVGYWLDAEGRLRKVETLLADGMPTTIELFRDDRQDFVAVAALGGRDIEPREVTDVEAELLALLRQRNYHAKGAEVTVTLPAFPGTLRRATGWLDWRRSIAYLSVRDLDDPGKSALVHANQTGVSLRKPDDIAPESPPLPAPRGGWEHTAWSELTRNPQVTDIDIILFEVMSMALNQPDNAQRMKAAARRLRVDLLNDEPVGVFELPNTLEQRWAPGTARVRYWVDNSGVLRRLELRTRSGGLAQFDLTPNASLPPLPLSVE